MAFHDPIVEEVRKVRDARAAKFNYDLDAIIADIRRSQRESGRKVVSYLPNRIGETKQPEVAKSK